MKLSFLSSLLILVPILLLSQNKIDLKAEFSTEKKQIKIAQTITYFNNTEDTLYEIYLNDWNHSFATKTTPLAKRFAEEYNADFHFAKNDDRGYSVITSVKQNQEDLEFDRLIDHIDVIKVFLKTPLKPKESYTINLNYIVQVPSDKFTRYGMTSQGDFNLRYWYMTPAVYNGEWQYASNKNLDDLFIPVADLTFELKFPNTYHLTSELDQIDIFQKDSMLTVSLEGKNRINSKLFLNHTKPFNQVKTDYFTMVSDIDDENLNMIDNLVITDQISEFLTKNLGSYPHEKLLVTDIDYRKNPIYGLNLLPNFIRPFPDKFQYELKLLKTALNNYLDNVIITNPRKDQWIIDGLQTYYLMKYVEEYYPNMKLAGSLSKIWGIRSFHAAQLDFNDQYAFLYMHMARENLDQPLTMEKDSLLKFNKNIANKYKAGVGLRYLDQYVNADVVENSIKEFISKFEFKESTTADFQTILQENTYKNINWFFTDYLNTKKYIDFTISEIQESRDSVKVTIKNKTQTNVPISLFVLNKDSIISKIWIDNIKDTKSITVPKENGTKVVLNKDFIVPEFNLRDNTKSLTNSIFNRPLQLRLIKDIEDPRYNQVFFMPIVEFDNIYDGIVLGLKAYNKTVLKKAFYYKVSPQYGTRSNSFTGGVTLNYNQYIKNNDINLFSINYGVTASYASYAEDLFVRKLTPGIQFLFRDKSNLMSNKKQFVTMRLVDIHRDQDLSIDADETEPNYSVFDFRYNNINKGLEDYISWFSDVQFSKDFGKISFNFEYRKLTEKSRQYNIRFFLGTFLYNDSYQTSDYFSFALDRPTDYLFDYNYYGRSESSGLFSQQIIIAEGGFKSKLNTPYANEWISTINGSTTIWKYILAYGDIGMVKNHGQDIEFVYDTGIRISLIPDYFELYFPVYSNLGWEVAQSQYAEKIRFVVTLDFKTLFGLFSRRWY
ncbi:gluzincin family metallopeptidase [Formosa maritima]|uniref:M1 family metallopeptidase n=1 Tax=Formosa maritima TaxID=2592046 RepID=A0A5D0GEG6_9FLAO|nr:M1 family metallopeptidase [Formosa maritima]TYA57334.1 M1 family metallopeptidase [Formosa maritima]